MQAKKVPPKICYMLFFLVICVFSPRTNEGTSQIIVRFFLFFWLFCIFCLAKKGGKTANTEYLRILFVVSRCLFFVSFSRKKNTLELSSITKTFRYLPETLGDIFRDDPDMKKKIDGRPDFWGSHQYIYICNIFIDIFQQLKGFDLNHIK